MNFRDYATKIRSKAAEAANRIPTFDQMAATDDYIHSEEFNVRGQPKAQRSSNLLTRNPSQVADSLLVEPDEASSMGSWSLLDRPAPSRYPAPTTAIEKRDCSYPYSSESSIQGGVESGLVGSNSASVTSDGPAAAKKHFDHSLSSLPVLSIVANALKKPTVQRTSMEENNGTRADSEEEDYDEDDHSSFDSDDDDPIMSLVREKYPTNKSLRGTRLTSSNVKKRSDSKAVPTTEKNAIQQKSSQRFFDNLDDRIVSSEPDVETGPAPSLLSAKILVPPTSGIFGGWVQNVAMAQVNRLLRRQEQAVTESSATAPLSRERPRKITAAKKPEEDFHRAASSSVLADDELVELAKFKQSTRKGTLLAILGYVHENRQFAFILFTLFLAAFVYLFQRSEDDVT